MRTGRTIIRWLVVVVTLSASGAAQAAVQVNPQGEEVRFRVHTPGGDCAGYEAAQVVISTRSASTTNTTEARCDRFPNDALSRGAGWVQRGQAGRSVFVPRFDSGTHFLRFEVVRNEHRLAHGNIRVRAYKQRRTGSVVYSLTTNISID